MSLSVEVDFRAEWDALRVRGCWVLGVRATRDNGVFWLPSSGLTVTAISWMAVRIHPNIPLRSSGGGPHRSGVFRGL